jgi:RHS repeat-associated protein
MKLSEVRIIDENGNESGEMVFSYTDDGTPVMFTYNGEEYYYKVNLLGDVEEIFTPKGVVGRYCYDGWGNILKTESLDGSDIININPIRYRGYLYDGETGLYYLHTRYYDPALGRRLNADGYSSGSSQGYVYAQNDPVGNIDPTMKVEYPLCNQLHLYSGNAKPVAGKINVLFMPTIANPVFQIENSYKIVDEAQQRAVLEYIMESEMYVQEIYCRTLESMLVEWKAHNRIFATSPNERCRHVDFDKNDEGLTYSDFWKRAMREYGIQIG